MIIRLIYKYIMQEISFLPLRVSSHPLLDKIESTYTGSFPPDERRPFPLLRCLIDEQDLFAIGALLQNETYIGFLSYWDFETFRYVEHFAVDPLARGGGLGGKCLNLFLSQSDKPVVLEVELPEDEMSRRRIGFYERHGFVLCQHPYYQPSYYGEFDVRLEMRLMTWGNLDINSSFVDCVSRIHPAVYGVKSLNFPLDPGGSNILVV